MKIKARLFSLLFFFLLIIGCNVFSQTSTFEPLDTYKDLSPTYFKYLKKGSIAHFNSTIVNDLLSKNPNKIDFIFYFENKVWEISLEKAAILSNGFFVTTGKNPTDKLYDNSTALHYKGIVKGKPTSFAAMSILNDKIVAVVSDERGNINIGAINTPEARLMNEHIIYRDADLLIKNEFECNTESVSASSTTNPIPVYAPVSPTATTINAEPIDIYFETDYATFLNNGSNVTNVVNYVTALFNVVHTLFENDSINTKISSIMVWNIVDPYNSISTSSAVLNAFANNMSNGFPGDLAHFLSQRGLGGGVANLNVLCDNDYRKTAVSGNLSNSFNPFPIYSWSSMVITHELGHNVGSPHTQSCSWPGGVALDNCYATEGGCPQGPAPTNGGTIMSYCHLTGYGTNLANGFGPFPGQKIRSFVRNNPCINPGVYFETTFQNVLEESADVENGCLDYKLITTKLKIPYGPSAPANITLLPIGSNGLVLGTNNDIEISPMNFTLSSSNLSQTISFKIYNDALIENIETVSLNFDINPNGGNAEKRNINNVNIINITSDDYRPDSTTNQLLFVEDFNNIATGLGSWTQTVNYGILSPNRWIIRNSGDADFPTNAAYISNNGVNNAYAGSSVNDSTIVRLESPTINANSFSNLKLTYLYKSKGEFRSLPNGGQGGSSVLDYGKLYYSINNGISWILLKDNIFDRNFKSTENISIPPDADNANSLKIAFEWRNNSSIVNNPPFIIDSIVIKGTSTSPIQTTTHIGNMDEEYLGPNQTIHFYNPITKNIMATIENLSAFDFGCTKVELVRTGVGATQAWGIYNDQKISDKVFKITAANVNPSAPYNLKLYYANDEINGLLATTGNTITDLKIVKTNGDLTLVPPNTTPVFSSINSKTNYGIAPHTIFEGNFTGFSTFAVMKPYILPECPNNNISYAASITGTNYQWQVDSGLGYSNLNNAGIYADVTTNLLQLNSPPTSNYGNKYRCAINTPLGLVYSPEYTLKFGMTWLGTTSKAWENTLNWNCGLLPDSKTDVYINGGTIFTPELSTNATIRSIRLSSSTDLLIRSGSTLIITN